MLHAHAQIAALTLTGEFAAQAAEVHGVGHHDLKNKQGAVGSAFAQNGLEAFNVHVMTGEHAAHGRDEAGFVRAVGSDYKGLAVQVLPPLALDGGAHQHRQVNLGLGQTGAEILAQTLGICSVRSRHHKYGGKLPRKYGLGHFFDIAAVFFKNTTDRGHNAWAVAPQK